MSSILTNYSAMSAVAILNATQRASSKAQTEMTTGLRVASAADDPSYWAIATLMRSNVSTLGAIKDSLNLTNSIVSVTNAARSFGSEREA